MQEEFSQEQRDHSRPVDGEKRKSQALVPGMSQYSDSQDVDMDAGTAQYPGSLSFSTSAVSHKKVPQEFDISSEASEIEKSMNNFE